VAVAPTGAAGESIRGETVAETGAETGAKTGVNTGADTGAESGAETGAGRRMGRRAGSMFAALQSAHEMDDLVLRALEVTLAATCAVYVAVYAMGRVRNERIMREMARRLGEAAARLEFAHVGVQPSAPDERGRAPRQRLLQRDGPNHGAFFASGKRSTPHGVTVTLALRARHELFSVLKTSVLYAQGDQLRVIVPLDGVSLQPSVVLLVQRVHLHYYRAAHPDVDLYCDQLATPAALQAIARRELVLASDAPDATALLNAERVARLLRELVDCVVALHVTDQGADASEPQAHGARRLVLLTLDARGAAGRNAGDVAAAGLELGVALAEALPRWDAARTASGVERARMLRRKVAEVESKGKEKSRKEQLAERAEARKREEREKVEAMSRDEQLKYEEKQRRKELKKRNNASSGVRLVKM